MSRFNKVLEKYEKLHRIINGWGREEYAKKYGKDKIENDCAVRAIGLATVKPYEEVYKGLEYFNPDPNRPIKNGVPPYLLYFYLQRYLKWKKVYEVDYDENNFPKYKHTILDVVNKYGCHKTMIETPGHLFSTVVFNGECCVIDCSKETYDSRYDMMGNIALVRSVWKK